MKSKILVEEPIPYRVFQRDSDNRASIPFSLSILEAIQGRLEVRSSATSWKTVGIIERQIGQFSGFIESVPIGQHNLSARIVSEQADEVLAEILIGPIFVGDLWLLAGQSNMEGCGKLIDVDEPQPGVSCFYFGDRWDLAVEPLSWQLESDDPVHRGNTGNREQQIQEIRRNRVLGSGLGLAFGKHLLRETGIPVGLIMVAQGATSMAQWDPALAHLGGGSLYGSMLRVVQAVGGRVKGCLWYQGESDTTSDEAPFYYDRFGNFVQSLRRDLNDSSLPFIYAQLGPVMITLGTVPAWPEESQWNRIQHEQLRMESELENMYLVPTIDAKLDDFIHLSTDSLREIGKRMAWAALASAYDRPVAQTGPRLSRTVWNDDRTELLLDFSGINGAFRPVERLFGFLLVSGSIPLPLEAHLSEDNRRIVLRLETPVPADCSLCHGSGLNPVINARDELGFPLVVFGPIAV
ncbi:sialate O-acetylesterase [Cohnella silvisoli]|uniref:Sialate O-acetylesterase n=1 Tax=Cohnella silvisoli TaxID=2873699 RepID=A0ABV1L5G6_9BACL|nr:sialate O-acetylesterase [Cohnella silvisoli]MCD9026169.1 sialate O-acetylesterase [Cohnella silvisoli]